ncbi:hypothetical protein BKA82DRAFT_2874459 [Pisolithus tinctorius]|nr:hypothetical protein BKA82DRAFT_2874459 [Pisolithus tinctorius]
MTGLLQRAVIVGVGNGNGMGKKVGRWKWTMNTSDDGERLISPSHPPTSSPRELRHSWFLFLYRIFHPSPIPSRCARHPTYFALEVGKVADVLGDRGSRCGACLCFVVLTILPSPLPFVVPYANSRNPPLSSCTIPLRYRNNCTNGQIGKRFVIFPVQSRFLLHLDVFLCFSTSKSEVTCRWMRTR